MDDLKPLAVFAEVVDAGSMSGAARRLGMSPSAVSQTIRALEQHGGVTLLHRSTRKLALTEAGERYYPHCQRMLEAARAAAQSLQHARDAPTGELRVSAPVGFAIHVAPALAPLLDAAPELRLRLLVDDAMIDLIDHRVDVAIRAGRLADSNWIARRLCDFDMILCASPDYLERRGTPATLQQLPAHQWLAFGRETPVDGPHDGFAAPGNASLGGTGKAIGKGALAVSQPATMPLDMHSAAGERHRIHVQARIASNNQISLQQMCEHGLGLARLALPDAASALARGTLVRVLPQWKFAAIPVWAVTPRRDEAEAAKVRVAVDALRRYFATLAATVPADAA